MGMLGPSRPERTLECSIVSAQAARSTVESLTRVDKYRLTLKVRATLRDKGGAVLWQHTFSDWATYTEGSTAEAALEETCGRISLQIARAVASLAP
jgi:outer membrane lipopolysaccharide assembly protein LptE/RlpB